MQLTTITAILVAAVSASATPLNARQASRSVTGTLYNNNLVWHGDSVGTSTFVQCVPGGFHDLTVQVPGAITDTDFSNDTLKRTSTSYMIKIYGADPLSSSLICHSLQPGWYWGAVP